MRLRDLETTADFDNCKEFINLHCFFKITTTTKIMITNFLRSLIKHSAMPLALVSLLTAGTQTADALPAKKGLRTLTQPDGTEIRVTVRGNGRGHITLDESGRVLVSDASGKFCYATTDVNGKVVSTGIMAKPENMLTANEKAILAKIDNDLTASIKSESIAAKTRKYNSTRAVARKRVMDASGSTLSAKDPNFRMVSTGFPNFGEQKALVILVSFKDIDFRIPNPQKYFDDMLNKEGYSENGHVGSCHDYFKKSSFDQFKPKFDVVGPVKLSKNSTYYGQNDPDMDDQDMHPEEIVIEACQQLDATLDFKEYDRDGDGWIDNVYVFYAGYGEADGGAANTVWPHAWNVYLGAGRTLFLDGKRLDHYAMSNELQYGKGYNPTGIGTFIHEFSHVMGLPDLYTTEYNNAFTPGEWDVLDYGPYNGDGKVPPIYSAFERFSLGWIKPTEITKSGSLNSESIYDSNTCHIVYTKQPQEFFLFETRVQKEFDKYIPNSGLLVWHIDFNQAVWDNNEVNNTVSHQYVDLVEADGSQNEYSRAGDCFPGTRKITAFDGSTRPAFVDWKNQPLGVDIKNISFDGTKTTMETVVDNSGVDQNFADDNCKISVSGNVVRIEGEGTAEIFDLFGRRTAMISGGNETCISNPGIYMIRTGKITKKVIIK